MDEAVAQGQEPARVVEADRQLVLLLALLGGGQHVLESVLDEANGTREAAREERDQDVLGIDDELGAEAPAHVGREHAHLVGGEVEQVGDELADLMRHLGGGPHRQLAEGRVPVRHEPAGLHRLAAATADAQADRGHPRRRAQRRLDVPASKRHAPGHVVGDVVVDGGCARREGLRRRQGLVLHLQQLARVLRRVAAVRHHRGHRLAHEAGAVARERGEVVPAQLGVRRHHGHGASRGPEIGEGHHVHHPRVDAGPGRIDAGDARVRVRAAQEHRVEQAGQRDVRHVAPAAGEQARVLLAEMPVADELHADAPASRPAAAASSAACTMCW